MREFDQAVSALGAILSSPYGLPSLIFKVQSNLDAGVGGVGAGAGRRAASARLQTLHRPLQRGFMTKHL